LQFPCIDSSKNKTMRTNKFLPGRFSNSLGVSRSSPRPEAAPTSRAKIVEVDGEELTAEDFVYVGNRNDSSTWALPWNFSDKAERQLALRNAAHNYQNDSIIPPACHEEVRCKLVRLGSENGLKISFTVTPTNASNSSDTNYDLLLKRIQIERMRCS
jgi:hypothetical protein